MTRQELCALAVLAAALSGCVSYRLPAASAEVSLVLTRDDVEILREVKGEDWAIGFFSATVLHSTIERAALQAMHKATQAAHEQVGADFILEPRTKATYFNFLLFDFAQVEVVGKAVRIKEIAPRAPSAGGTGGTGDVVPPAAAVR